MGIASGIALIAIGAILAFAVELDLAGLNIDMIGVILMIVGVVGILLDLIVWGPRRTVHTEYVDTPRREVVRERDVY